MSLTEMELLKDCIMWGCFALAGFVLIIPTLWAEYKVEMIGILVIVGLFIAAWNL